MPPAPADRGARGRLVGELVVALAGLALLALAWRADLRWFERRFAFDDGSAPFVVVWRVVMIGLGGALLVVVRPRVGQWVERVGPGEAAAACARMGIALALSVVASEAGLRILRLPRRYDTGIAEARLGEKNARYGWLFKASQSFTVTTGGRPVRYDFDADHDRARSTDDVPDPTRPTLFFVGESVTAGHGLGWEESYPAIVGSALGMQVIDLGVDGYASDQAFLRLADTLPRFEHPVAVVTMFMPFMVDRLAACDHPRLVFDGAEPRLVPRSLLETLRLSQALRASFGYRSEDAIQAIAEIFRQTELLAKRRGARAVFVAPFLDTKQKRLDSYLVDELLVRQGFTTLDASFGFEPIPGDNHPNAASTQRLAEMVILALRAELDRRD